MVSYTLIRYIGENMSLALIDTVLSGIFGIINRIVPDKNQAAKIQAEIEMYKLTSDFQNAMAQIKVNEAEGTHASVFVSGWRPFIGWVCGCSFAWHVILVPVIVFISSMAKHPIPLPTFDVMLLMNVLFGMLGLGGFRTYEKVQANKLKYSRNEE